MILIKTGLFHTLKTKYLSLVLSIGNNLTKGLKLMKKNGLLTIFSLVLLLVMVIGIYGCARKIHPPPVKPRDTPSREVLKPPAGHPESVPATQRQYTVLGQTYTPLSTHEGYVEEGIASWYGPKFHGNRTSSGEVFNMYELTAAHRVLPINTKVRVTNLDNGRVLDLRINDRGPFARDRIIDLSFGAAREMGMIGPGTARVRVEALGSVPRSSITGIFYVQVGSFSSRENALKLKEEMQKKGYLETRLQEFSINSQQFWRVQAGRFTNLQAAENAHSKFLREIPGAFVIAD